MNKTVLLVMLGLVACKKEEASVQSKPAAVVASLEANDQVWAASAHLRMVDAKSGAVKGIDLQKAIRNVVFTRDGSRAFLAASDGVREVDATKGELTAQLTQNPARHVELSEDGQSLFVLEHQLIVHPDQTREILPFHLVTIELATRKVVADEEIGQRVLYAHPSTKERWGLVVFEKGDLVKIAPGQKLSSEGVAIDPFFGQPSKYGARPREGAAVHGGKIYLPMEAEIARVIEVDLTSGEASPILLGRPYSLRGVAFGADRMFVNAGIALLGVDLKTRAVASTLELGAPHTGIAISSDARFAYLAQTVDGTGGAVTVVSLADVKAAPKKIHIDDISPWALAVRPRPELATR
jgi:hypothetical protein